MHAMSNDNRNRNHHCNQLDAWSSLTVWVSLFCNPFYVHAYNMKLHSHSFIYFGFDVTLKIGYAYQKQEGKQKSLSKNL